MRISKAFSRERCVSFCCCILCNYKVILCNNFYLIAHRLSRDFLTSPIPCGRSREQAGGGAFFEQRLEISRRDIVRWGHGFSNLRARNADGSVYGRLHEHGGKNLRGRGEFRFFLSPSSAGVVWPPSGIGTCHCRRGLQPSSAGHPNMRLVETFAKDKGVGGCRWPP